MTDNNNHPTPYPQSTPAPRARRRACGRRNAEDTADDATAETSGLDA